MSSLNEEGPLEPFPGSREPVRRSERAIGASLQILGWMNTSTFPSVIRQVTWPDFDLAR